MKPINLASFLVLGFISAAGCASTEYDRATVPGEPRTNATLDLVLEHAGAEATVPGHVLRVETPALGHRLNNQVIAELGGEARAGVRLCIAGSGEVTEVAVVRSSGLDALDAALVAEARRWRYQPLAAATVSACHAAQIRYRVR